MNLAALTDKKLLAACVCLLGADMGNVALAQPPGASTIRGDEVVEFFPTLASPTADGHWLVRVHGWIYEPEADSLRRAAGVKAFQEAIGLADIAPRDAEGEKFLDRITRRFLVDNERHKRVAIRIGAVGAVCPESDDDGHFVLSGTFGPGELRADPGCATTKVTVKVDLPESDTRAFLGTVYLLSAEGVSIVSDIDDTIKVSEVRDRSRLVLNTFCRAYEPVPGMAALYKALSDRGAALHYLSGSPFQLAAPLAEFMEGAGFPPGSLHLRRIRLKEKSALAMFDSPEEHKLGCLRELAAAWPKRRFVLVGDSGERDPEIYGRFAREHPGHVLRIAIRDVTAEPRDAARYSGAFEGLAAETWLVFDPERPPAAQELLSTIAVNPAR